MLRRNINDVIRNFMNPSWTWLFCLNIQVRLITCEITMCHYWMCCNCVNRSYRDRTGKMRSFWEANRPLVPMLMCLIVCAIWAYHSPTDIISRDPRAYFLMTGTIFSNICVSWHAMCSKQYIFEGFLQSDCVKNTHTLNCQCAGTCLFSS